VRDASRFVEEPAFFPAGTETLFGIVSRPLDSVKAVCIVALAGGGYTGTTTRYAPPVVMSRLLAERGYPAMRFDYHGVGESTGDVARFTLGELFRDDVEGAVRFVAERNLGSIVLLGYCFGARTAMAAMPKLEDVRAAVLLSPPLQDYDRRTEEEMIERLSARDLLRKGLTAHTLRGLLDPDRRRAYARIAKKLARGSRSGGTGSVEDAGDGRWVSRRYIEPLKILVERRVPTLIIYGKEDDYYEDFLRARQGQVGRILEQGGSAIEVVTIEGRFHAFPKTSVREESFQLVADWLTRHEAAISG
jgi:pimeloyl-ACP methyl ester carboxylesterase